MLFVYEHMGKPEGSWWNLVSSHILVQGQWNLNWTIWTKKMKDFVCTSAVFLWVWLVNWGRCFRAWKLISSWKLVHFKTLLWGLLEPNTGVLQPNYISKNTESTWNQPKNFTFWKGRHICLLILSLSWENKFKSSQFSLHCGVHAFLICPMHLTCLSSLVQPLSAS